MFEKRFLQKLIKRLDKVVKEMDECSSLTAFKEIDVLIKEEATVDLIPPEIIKEGMEIEAQLTPLVKKYVECYRKLLDAVKQSVSKTTQPK